MGRKIIANRITGYLPGRIVFFLMNLHITPRPIWLTRHGESEFNAQERIGIPFHMVEQIEEEGEEEREPKNKARAKAIFNHEYDKLVILLF